MRQAGKRILVWLLAVVLVCSLVPGSQVQAEEPAQISGTFVLVGDTAHGTGEAHTVYEKWLEVPYTADEGDSILDIFRQVLTENNYTFAIYDSDWGEYLDSVTTPDGVTLGSGTNAQYSGWMYYVNNEYNTTLADGDRIQFLYVDDYSTDPRIDEDGKITSELDTADSEPTDPEPTDPEPTDPDVVLPDYTADWSGFGSGASNNKAISAKTAYTADGAQLKWSALLREGWVNVSDPIIVNGQVYVAVGSTLKVLDSAGQVVKEAPLAGSIDYTCRLAYSQGKIIVPLNGGAVQALAADTLKEVWKAEALEAGEQGAHQAMTTVTCSHGLVILGTAIADWTDTYGGVYRALDEKTGKVVWAYENNQKGYYWSGAAVVGDTVIFAGDDGVLQALNVETGTSTGTLNLGGKVRGTVVADGSWVYVTTTDGVLHKAEVLADGTFGAHQSVQFAGSSTGTPAIANGSVFVGGYSVLAVIDAESMKVTQTFAADGDVKSAPLVTTGYEGHTYVYYTVNNTPGALYVADAEAGRTEALYTPEAEAQNYCMASPIADAAGTLYYTNDSGVLFAISAKSVSDPEPTNPESTNPQPTDPEPTNPQPTDPEPTSPQPTVPETKAPETTAPGNAPATGDSNMMWIYVGVLCVAVVVMTGTGVASKKNKR